jgi:TonB family protein
MKFVDSPYSLSLTHERRRVRRRKVDSVVYVNIGRDNGGVLLDLSEGGMCISVANPLAVSSEIQFELGFTGNLPIEGTGQVSWVSESGKSAGVRFSSLSNESRVLIRKRLEGTAGAAKKMEPVIATGSTTADARQPSEQLLSRQAPANSETATAGETLHGSESRDGLTTPYSPLFFLPKRPAADEVSEELPFQAAPYTWQSENAGPDSAAETVQAFRAAIVSTPETDEETRPEERRFKKAAIVFTVCLALLAAGVAAVVAYPKRFAELRQFTVSLTELSRVAPASPAKATRSTRRIRREATKRPMFPVSGPQRGRRPVGYSGIFDAPSDSGSQFSAGASGGSQQTWSARASGRRLAPRETATETPGAEPALDSSTEDGGERVSKPTEVADSGVPAQTGRLRIDGGLVDEGSVSPTFAPLNLDGQTLDSKPIVVQAVIGKDGGVEDVRLLSSPASKLAEAVVSAVKQWRYRPFYRDGKPVEFVTRITFDFSLPNGSMR